LAKIIIHPFIREKVTHIEQITRVLTVKRRNDLSCI